MPSGSVIIFSSNEEMLENISLSAKEFGFKSVSISDGKNARELIENGSYDLAVINTPLADEFGLDLADFASKHGCGVIIAASAKLCDEIAKKIGRLCVFVLPKPLNKTLLLQTFRFVMLAHENKSMLQSKTSELENKLQNTKLVDRAKCVLIQYLRMSEADAHRYIQKRAMDMHIPQTEVAQDILKTYEM
ncbi:MAG: ANTAR domain-containing protein [Oscillospiraceae bacterium]|nr:ANTAR domain-containing protein [Oscillospiraceae bacterium]